MRALSSKDSLGEATIRTGVLLPQLTTRRKIGSWAHLEQQSYILWMAILHGTVRDEVFGPDAGSLKLFTHCPGLIPCTIICLPRLHHQPLSPG